MTGILAFGAGIPRRRLALALLAGREGPVPASAPSRTVAWADEDAVTLGVQAARECLQGEDRSAVDVLFFASTTAPFAEKQSAAIVAAALGLSPQVRTVDVAASLRGGTQALLLALDAVRAGSARRALVIAADCREGAPGSALEANGGDAAVALLVGEGDALLEVAGTATHTEEILDVWRRPGDRFVHTWEERFVITQGFQEPVAAAVRALVAKVATGLLGDHGGTSEERRRSGVSDAFEAAAERRGNERGARAVAVEASAALATGGAGAGYARTGIDAQFDHIVLSAPDARAHAALAKRVAPGVKVADALFGRVGACGAAHALLQLALLAESALPGERVLLVNHGDGADAFALRVVRTAPVRVASALASAIPIPSMKLFRVAREHVVQEWQGHDYPGISAAVHHRERGENLALIGQRCACGAPHFPRGRICAACGAHDRFAPECFAERGATLISFTLDHFFPTPEPPTAVGVVQIDDGPRMYLQLADIDAATLRTDAAGVPALQPGLRLRLVFRRIHTVGGRPNYFWKAVPAEATT